VLTPVRVKKGGRERLAAVRGGVWYWLED